MRRSDLQLESWSWVQTISQSVSRSGLCLTVRPGLVAISTPPPLPAPGKQSFRITVMLNGGGNISVDFMSGANQVSVPIIMSGLSVVTVCCNWAAFGLTLRKLILRRRSVV